jgi:hypothetical protein
MFSIQTSLGMAEHLADPITGRKGLISVFGCENVELFSSSCGRKVEDSEEEVTLIDRLEGNFNI